ncbi:MAG: hypothetical protein WB696_32445 [Chthoniobacterales bacterium]|jgi:hypothetical protein
MSDKLVAEIGDQAEKEARAVPICAWHPSRRRMLLTFEHYVGSREKYCSPPK